MPGPGGLQTLFVLKNTPETSEIPAIVVSGINPRILGLMPAAAYLQKPVEKQKFVQTVRKCLNAALSQSIEGEAGWRATATHPGLPLDSEAFVRTEPSLTFVWRSHRRP